MIIKIWLIAFLLICAVTDIYERNVYTMFCVANGIVLSIMNSVMKECSTSSMILGLLLGICFIIIAKLSKGAIGAGDGIVLCVIGLAIGVVEMVEALVWALIICIVVGISGMSCGRLRMKSKLPFVPFLFLGSVITMVAKGV